MFASFGDDCGRYAFDETLVVLDIASRPAGATLFGRSSVERFARIVEDGYRMP